MTQQPNDSELRDYLTKEVTYGRAISYDTLQFYGTLSEDDKNKCSAIDNIVTRIQDEILKARIETIQIIDSTLRFENIPLSMVQAESLKQYMWQLESQLTKLPKEGE